MSEEIKIVLALMITMVAVGIIAIVLAVMFKYIDSKIRDYKFSLYSVFYYDDMFVEFSVACLIAGLIGSIGVILGNFIFKLIL